MNTTRALPATLLFSAGALLCFAGNSLLCRMALADHQIDPRSFTAIRLASGALMLWLIVSLRPTVPIEAAAPAPRRFQGWFGALSLFVYAAPFSVAYVELEAGTGALILFGTVQLGMFGWSIARGERIGFGVWCGLALAASGLALLTLPGASAPDLVSSLYMALGGLGWAAYSLLGRAARDPTRATADHFARSLPLVALWLVLSSSSHDLTFAPSGLVLAAASGALASGVGYVLWYAALRELSATSAALLQLLVPVITAVFGVALLDEAPTPRLVLSSALVIGGVALAIRTRELGPGRRGDAR
jgi:drug/metabolite transporter (DMT)-like permease